MEIDCGGNRGVPTPSRQMVILSTTYNTRELERELFTVHNLKFNFSQNTI